MTDRLQSGEIEHLERLKAEGEEIVRQPSGRLCANS